MIKCIMYISTAIKFDPLLFSAHLSDMPGIHRNSLAVEVIFDFPISYELKYSGRPFVGRSICDLFLNQKLMAPCRSQVLLSVHCKIKHA